MSEIYVNITGYPNYQVSNFGNVKNVKTGRILKPVPDRYGYLKVSLSNGGDISTKSIHKLVASEFLQNPENKACVDHIDRNRTNNHTSNLRYATVSENSQNASMKSNNTSGVTGVSFHKLSQKWRAEIRVNESKKHLGYFVRIEDAIRARHDAEVLYFGEFRAV